MAHRMRPRLFQSLLAAGLTAISLLSPSLSAAAQQTGIPGNSGPASGELESGIESLHRHAPAEAKTHFTAAIKANPSSANALTWRGIAEEQLDEYTAAVRDFEAALQIDSSLLSAHYNLALACIRLKNMNRALDEMRFVVNAEPGVIEPQYNLALLLEQAGARGEAIEHLKAALKISPGDTGVIQHLVVDLLDQGAGGEVQRYLDDLARAASPQTANRIATALLESQHFSEAAYLLERTANPSQPDVETRLLLARAYLGAHDDSKAINLLQPLEMEDATGEAAYLLGLAFADTGATTEAKNAFAMAVKRAPRNAAALFHLGILESVVPDQLPVSIGHLRVAVQIEPKNPTYRIMLGKLLLEHDEERAAETVLTNTHAVAPEAGERDLLLGIAQIIVHGPASATAVLENSVKEDPSLALSHNMLGFCYFSQGEMAKAAESYATASDLDPQNRLFAHAAAVAFERSGNVEQQKQYANRAANRPDASGEDHFLLAKGLAKAGDTHAAIQQLNEAIGLDPNLEASYYLLVRCYMQEGNSDEASLWAEKLKQHKQTHQQTLPAPSKNAEPVRSSGLLHGTSIGSAEADTPQ